MCVIIIVSIFIVIICLVLCQVRFAGNFGVKARIIDDRKLVRIGTRIICQFI